MKDATMKTLIGLLLLITATVHSQPENGQVLFDAPNMPSPEFQFDLDQRVIALVMEDPNSNLVPLFGTVDNLRLHNYRSRSVDFKELVRYYSKALDKRGWDTLGQESLDIEKDNLHLYTLEESEIVRGIFTIVKSSGDVYLINIVGEIPKKQLGELLLNLNQLGIEIPELMHLRPRDLEIAAPLLPATPDPIISVPEPSITIDTHESVRAGTDKEVKPPLQKKVEPSLEKPHKPVTPRNWQFDGKPIHGFRIESSLSMPEGTDPKSMEQTIAAEKANIMKILENGSGDIVKVMPILTSVLLNSSREASLRLEQQDTKHIAIITVNDIPATHTISVLESLTIAESGDQTHRSISDRLFFPGASSAAVPTRFLAADAPIHEIRIRGNRKVPEARIRQTLENGSEDIEQALKSLFKVMPYFEEISLKVDEENAKYIATITVDEKPLSNNVYLGLNPSLRLGFTRVTGWEIGTGFEVGRRKEIGPLWMWNVRNSEVNEGSNFFGKASYAFGNPHLHYRVGGRANWGKPYVWNLGLTAQMHRLTDVVAPELFQNYNSGIAIFQRILGMPDFQNYYLRQGAEIALEWSPIMPNHWFKLVMVTESHASLQKSTDWFVTNWTSSLRLRDNPPITPGQMRSIAFQYDFHKRTNSLGWHNTLFLEHSNSTVGSDFDFTRLQLHLRYAFPLRNNRIRTRFLFGFSDASLPIQRQFVIGGMGGLRGYPWSRQENGSDGIITYKSGHQASPYAFAGDRGFLLNVEYHYRLSNLFDWRIYENMFLIAFLDEGQVWNVSDGAYTFDPKGNIGIGLQFGRSNSVTVVNIRGLQSGRNDFIVRFNIAKALEAGTGIQLTTTWYHSF